MNEVALDSCGKCRGVKEKVIIEVMRLDDDSMIVSIDTEEKDRSPYIDTIVGTITNVLEDLFESVVEDGDKQ